MKGTLINLETFRNIGKKIEKIAEENNVGYIETAVDYCEKNNLEIDFIGDIISQNPNLKAKIEFEAETLRFMRKK